ncbi:leucine--tRNA ligase [Spiroplasma endosymbiont of Crioceris asparagi]|uniref:leucine--tRNA ligase n=1 Tax=Spiroplasma endosymbiont of Crioceris asparagi TaxID=3066286 RepID=UPI0030D42C9E
MEFSHKAIEKKWQKVWEENKTFKTTDQSKQKIYVLDMFPYPSGAGLHVGHTKGYTATDVFARFKKHQGFDVLHPIGYDAFGLPAEQYALKTGNDPRDFTLKNIANFRTQLKKMGYSYDFDKEIITSNPNYYKITQWIFCELFKKGLAEIRNVNVNWCPGLGTVLANEEIETKNGKTVSEVGGFDVFKKPMRQWVLKITNYADELLDGLNELDWSKSIKDLQKNWIGKSAGTVIEFDVKDSAEKISVFTTRADTIFGVSYIVLAPENNLVKKLVSKKQEKLVDDYIKQTSAKTDIERQDDSKPKNGVFLGRYAINPINGEEVQIWTGDYVLNDYATGSVMAVPAHDERDFKFASNYNLPIKFILESEDKTKAFVGESKYINSEYLDGLQKRDDAKNLVIKNLTKNKKCTLKVNYKLRDWLFSRQRFYGEPFPLAFDENNNIVLLEKELPVELPKADYIKPSGTGESPLANLTDWLHIERDGKKLVRETNTMPQWAASSWYHLAYILATSPNEFLDIQSSEAKALFKKWLPVDIYVGGQEHAVGHLLYARFWHRFLYDLGIVPTKEPFKKLINQGIVLDSNGEKMSKSKGNVINPEEIINSHGADCLRLYNVFMAPVEASLQWSEKGLDGARKWLDRVFRMIKNTKTTDKNNGSLDFIFNSVLQKYTQMMEDFKYNTGVSQLMLFVNQVYKEDQPVYKEYFEKFLIMLSPIAPHIAEELWEFLGHKDSIYAQPWPIFDPKKIEIDEVIIPIQINGKVKATLNVKKDTSKDSLIKEAKSIENIKKQLQDKNILKEIVVINKIINFVVK